LAYLSIVSPSDARILRETTTRAELRSRDVEDESVRARIRDLIRRLVSDA